MIHMSRIMFNHAALTALLRARPFMPFRLHLSDGGTVEVRSPEVVIVGKNFAVVGLMDPNAADLPVGRYTTVWYMHVTRNEMMHPGNPPFSAPPPSSSGSPSPVSS